MFMFMLCLFIHYGLLLIYVPQSERFGRRARQRRANLPSARNAFPSRWEEGDDLLRRRGVRVELHAMAAVEHLPAENEINPRESSTPRFHHPLNPTGAEVAHLRRQSVWRLRHALAMPLPRSRHVFLPCSRHVFRWALAMLSAMLSPCLAPRSCHVSCRVLRLPALYISSHGDPDCFWMVLNSAGREDLPGVT